MADVTGTYYAVEDAQDGYGAELQVGNGASPEVFESIAGVESITFPGMTTADIVTTHLRSPDAHQEHRPGLRDSTAMQANLRYLPNHQSQSYAGGGVGSFTGGGLTRLWTDRTIKNFRIKLADATIFPFRMYVSQFQPGQVANGVVLNAAVSFMPTQSFSADMP